MLNPRKWKYEDRLRLLFCGCIWCCARLHYWLFSWRHGVEHTLGTRRCGCYRRRVLLLSGPLV